ncbi:C40 family peptidase [Pluralibacter gergoviae]|uniref:C40 family peptidase n=1 Tax=Pluralibacter gergoviae TaxID=61647 RepID=UPI000907FB57|nr:C40 family peptidase [Pluralibacter gergoviae]
MKRCLFPLLFALFALLPVERGWAQPKEVKSSLTRKQAREAEQRKKNRERLMKKSHRRQAAVPPTPAQKRSEAEKKRLARAKNREMLAMHPRWRPGHLGGSDALWQPLPEARLSPKAEALLRVVMKRLKQQLGKPYVWGGQSPEQGFDCSGLVFYAWNHVLDRKLPRTANAMFEDRHLRQVRSGRLRRGDLVFFNINRRPGADHVGVYVGDGKFIEAPRSGLNIRISTLSDDFWQAHYLGARRVLTDDLS